MSVQDDVEAASGQFYAALNQMIGGRQGVMDAIWSHDATATTMHPIGGREVGWDAIRPVWDQVASLASGGEVSLADQMLSVSGDTAIEIGAERGYGILAGERVALDHRVTNVYRRENGAWKIVHHHADLSPAMIELLARLQAKR